MNITMTEWESTKAKLAADLTARWPWLRTRRHDELRIEAPVMTASASLRMTAKIQKSTVEVRVDGSACVTGGAADVAEAVRQMSEVRDAMLFLHGATRDLEVWVDGECPCGSCGARGVSQGQPCSRCDGKGKR